MTNFGKFACESGPARAYKKRFGSRAATCIFFAVMSSFEPRKPVTRSATQENQAFQDWVNRLLRTPGNAQERKHCNGSNLTVLPTPVGGGTYGTVLPVVVSGGMPRECVIKCCRSNGQEGLSDSMLSEIKAFKSLSGHPYVMDPFEIIVREKAGAVFFLMPYYPEGTLKHFIANRIMRMDARGREIYRNAFTLQLTEALEFIHSKGVYHRDLKPENVLVKYRAPGDCQICITDFGLAAFAGDPEKEDDLAYTVTVRPPETILDRKSRRHLPKGDVWSLGCVVVSMIVANDAFPMEKADCSKYRMDEDEGMVLLRIFKSLGTPTERTWPGVSGLPNWSEEFPQWPQRTVRDCNLCKAHASRVVMAVLERALVVNPAKRATAAELVRAFHDAI